MRAEEEHGQLAQVPVPPCGASDALFRVAGGRPPRQIRRVGGFPVIENGFRFGKTNNFLSGPVVKNPPSHAGDVGLIPARGTKIPRGTEQLSPCTTATEPALEPMVRNKGSPPRTATKTHHSQINQPKLKAGSLKFSAGPSSPSH